MKKIGTGMEWHSVEAACRDRTHPVAAVYRVLGSWEIDCPAHHLFREEEAIGRSRRVLAIGGPSRDGNESRYSLGIDPIWD